MFTLVLYSFPVSDKNLNKLAVLVAAALVIGTSVASPAFADDSSKTITKQANKQKQVLSGFVTEGEQSASNCIAVLNGENSCRQNGD